MVVTDTIKGVVDQVLWFHYDIGNDVLYLRLLKHRQTPTVSEETPDGLLLLRREDNDEPVGMTVVSWWKRFGTGKLPDSLETVGESIERWWQQHKLAA